jgi:malate/lactate dehydrogenase
MQRVAIIGAGELGGAVAHALARRDVARVVTLIDDAGRVAAGKALDIAQAAPIEQFATELAGANDVSMAAGADVVVIADRAARGEWQGEDALALLRRLAQTAGAAIVVCAGATQRELVERGVDELHIDPARLFGSAPEALAGAARALAALSVNASPRDVSLSVLGVPPHHTVIPWADASIGGFALTRLLEEPARRRLAARINALWPPGPYALAAAAALSIEGVGGRSRRLVSCFVSPTLFVEGAGRQARTGAMPVRLGRSGIVETVMPELTPAERLALDNAMQT